MDIRATIQRVTSSPVGATIRKRRRRKMAGYESSSSSSHYGTMKRIPQPTPSQNDPLSISISEQLDPYSGSFNINSILTGTTPYRTDYKDTDELGRYWKGIDQSPTSSSSKSSESHSSHSISSASSLPQRKKSEWPGYESVTESYSASYSSDSTRYETYSCSSVDCTKPRVHRPGVSQVASTVVPCPRTEQVMKRQTLPPLKERGYEKDLSLGKPYAHELGHIRTKNPCLKKYVDNQLNDHPSMKPRPWQAISEYTYSYSSCSYSDCDVRWGTRMKKVAPAKKKGLQQSKSLSHQKATSSSSSNSSAKVTMQKDSKHSSTSSSSRHVPKVTALEESSQSSKHLSDEAVKQVVQSRKLKTSQSSSSHDNKSSSERSINASTVRRRNKSEYSAETAAKNTHRSHSSSSKKPSNSSSRRSSNKGSSKSHNERENGVLPSSRVNPLETRARGVEVVAITGQYESNLRKD